MVRGSKVVAVLAVFALVFSLGMADESTEGEGKKKKKRSGARKGAILGGATGLALGALTGDASIAAKGAAAGAATGAASGAWYDYDQDRQDDRTEMLADSIAGNKSTDAAPTETVGDVGKRHLADLRGDWKVDVWVLDGDGKKVQAKGRAKGIAAGDNGVRVLYNDIRIEDYDRTLDGVLLLTYDPGQGFFLENTFTASDESLYFVGEFLVDKNTYNFFLTDADQPEMITPGMIRSMMRVEIRVASPGMWVADAFTHIDGEEVQVQSYRFTKS